MATFLEFSNMQRFLIAVCFVAAASAGLAQGVVREVTGNWAGLQENGYWFRAQLVEEQGKVRLRVWNGDLFSEPREPNLDVTGIVQRVSAHATNAQGLDVSVMDHGSELLIVSKSEDAGRRVDETVHIQFTNAQFLVVGYAWSAFDRKTGDAVLDCTVNLVSDVALVNGAPRDVPIHPVAAKTAANWTATSAIDLGYCPAGV
jgi:hypothetical protein